MQIPSKARYRKYRIFFNLRQIRTAHGDPGSEHFSASIIYCAYSLNPLARKMLRLAGRADLSALLETRNGIRRKYKGRGLSVIGFSLDDDGWKSVKPFLKEHPINYSVVIGNEDLGKLYGVEAMPVTLLIDRDGKIADLHVGMVDKDAFEGEIQVLLGDTAQSATK
jgi:hypothetical protein